MDKCYERSSSGLTVYERYETAGGAASRRAKELRKLGFEVVILRGRKAEFTNQGRMYFSSLLASARSMDHLQTLPI